MTTRTKQFHRYAITGFVAFLTLAGTTGNAWAGPACLRPRAAHAFATAAMQQRLMVAALTCNDVTEFNAFQTK